ncbi:MAG TPA: membrane protein insertion efficiency factor YidD [Verrucomicrobiales bacterium]|nr:membrane protein insertion efficiency factor YidD [Verrucomicrobiales bacterium]HIL72095.1 membrane protein insertion efficiency factor YidD [Verrucomicrobiota bacterium]
MVEKILRRMFIFVIRFYRIVLSPMKTLFLGPAGRCRYRPSCSEYALEAVTEHGALKGALLSLKRILRCHPWGGFGFDPVPRVKSGTTPGHSHSHSSH